MSFAAAKCKGVVESNRQGDRPVNLAFFPGFPRGSCSFYKKGNPETGSSPPEQMSKMAWTKSSRGLARSPELIDVDQRLFAAEVDLRLLESTP
jgi:hypothetical protein